MKKLLLIITLFGFTGTANAAVNLGSQAGFDTFSNELGGALAYRAVAPADPLGIIGFDIAVEGTNASFGGDSVIIPKIKFQKGLPGNLDIAGYYTQLPLSSISGVSGDGTAYGVALSYAIWEGGVVSPALAIRGSYTNADIPGVIGATTTGVDLEISKGFPIISPYAGIGLVNMSTTDSSGTACGGGGCADYSATETRYFAGANFNLKIMDIAFEVGKTGDNNFTTFKLGFRF
jgi:hypothetical protein